MLARRFDFGGTVMLKVAPRRTRRRQRGLSIIELMVGVAIGLFALAGATSTMRP